MAGASFPSAEQRKLYHDDIDMIPREHEPNAAADLVLAGHDLVRRDELCRTLTGAQHVQL
jgi:hypothetical protein